MENKSNNPNENIPGELENYNPVKPEFFADDTEFPSDETTGSGYSEAERDQHDGYNSGEAGNEKEAGK